MNTATQSVFDVTRENFEAEVLEASLQAPVLIDFWADWCAPCKALGPVLEKIAGASGGSFRLGKVNVDEQQELAAAFAVRSIPTVMLVKDGKPVDGFSGALPEAQVREFLTQHIQASPVVEGRPSEPANTAPVESPNQAITRLRQEITDQPDNTELKLDLIQALLQAGQSDVAEKELSALPDNATVGPRAQALRNGLAMASALDGAPTLEQLQQRVQADSNNWAARDLLGVRLLLGNDAQAGLEQFLYLLEHARDWNDNQARQRLLAAFAMLDDPALVSNYRRRMASLLF